MTEIYSVLAAFGTNNEAESAVQKLEREGLQRSLISIDNRVSPIRQGTLDLKGDDADTGSWAVTGALFGVFVGLGVNGDRFREQRDSVLSIDPFLSCLGLAVKGACIFAGISSIRFSLKAEVSRKQSMHDEPTLPADLYLLVMHGSPATVSLADAVLRAA